MDNSKIQFLRELIRLLPMTGYSIEHYSNEMGFNKSKLYNFKNGLIPKEEQYNHIIDFMIANHRVELAKIVAVLNVTSEDIYNLEDNIERYFEKISSKNL